MSRDWRLYLEDITESCEKVQRFTAGMERAALLADERTYDAVLRNLEVIGEAAKHVPDDVKQQMPGIEWRKISGLRDIVVHAYFGIDNEILWDIVQNKVPVLRRAIERFQQGNRP
jgi:uncharacterized protein with HEPN domain